MKGNDRNRVNGKLRIKQMSIACPMNVDSYCRCRCRIKNMYMKIYQNQMKKQKMQSSLLSSVRKKQKKLSLPQEEHIE